MRTKDKKEKERVGRKEARGGLKVEEMLSRSVEYEKLIICVKCGTVCSAALSIPPTISYSLSAAAHPARSAPSTAVPNCPTWLKRSAPTRIGRCVRYFIQKKNTRGACKLAKCVV